MLDPLDPKAFLAAAADPTSYLAKMAEFQRANLEAARKIAENNAQAFRELSELRDPQQFLTAQQVIVQAALKRNIETLTGLWQKLSDPLGANDRQADSKSR